MWLRLSDFSTLCFWMWNLQDFWEIQVVCTNLFLFVDFEKLDNHPPKNIYCNNTFCSDPLPPSGGRHPSLLQKKVLCLDSFFCPISQFNCVINICFMSIFKISFEKGPFTQKNLFRITEGTSKLLSGVHFCYYGAILWYVTVSAGFSCLLERSPASPVTSAMET